MHIRSSVEIANAFHFPSIFDQGLIDVYTLPTVAHARWKYDRAIVFAFEHDVSHYPSVISVVFTVIKAKPRRRIRFRFVTVRTGRSVTTINAGPSAHIGIVSDRALFLYTMMQKTTRGCVLNLRFSDWYFSAILEQTG